MGDSVDITPRVNYQVLPNFRGRTVRLVGKVLEQTEDPTTRQKNMTLSTSDNHVVTVHRDPGQGKIDAEIVEVIGNVEQDLTVTEVLCISFSNNPPFGPYCSS